MTGRCMAISFLLVLLPCGILQASESGSVSPEYREAESLFAAGQVRDALPLYQKLLTSRPHAVPVGAIQSRIGDSWFRLGNFQNALDAYRRALDGQAQAERPVTQYWIGFCCFLLGRNAEAVSEFLKIPGLYPASGMWVSTAYYWAGRASERMGKTDEAAVYYRRAGGSGHSTQGAFALKKAKAVDKP